MAIKNYKFFLGILFLFLAISASAQVGGAGSVYDSSVISKKKMNQQNQFWEGSYNFPAKPRNMWEIGASIGMFTISSDVSVRPFTFPNFEAHIRKAFGYVFSLRLQYLNAKGQGLNYNAAENFLKNPAWNINIKSVANRYFAPDRLVQRAINGDIYTDNDGHQGEKNVVYYNYQTRLQDLGLQGIVTLNNIRFHKQKTGIILYGGGGIGITAFETKVNAIGADGKNYKTLFNNVLNKYGSGSYKKRKDILKDLRAGMDKTYETVADNESVRRPVLGSQILKPSGTVLAGVAIKLGRRVNLAIEDRFSFVKTDLLDGQRWQEHPTGDAALTRDFDSYNYASLGLNVNLGARAVEPLWWVNPLDYAYDELRNHRNVKLPKNDCLDGDGDGVCDHLDREPNTPAGCPVDTHGVTRDTDGDGVPDCKDKQLITPTECQPVNADGVGKCPDPECCKYPKDVVVTPPNCPCDYPTLIYKGNTSGLSNDNRNMLATVAAKMKANPNCAITINGYPETSKASQANCQKRLETIKIYLIEKEGISADRINTNCVLPEGGTPVGDKNSVDIKCN
jgi:OmpA-OmpF porin, OOP family